QACPLLCDPLQPELMLRDAAALYRADLPVDAWVAGCGLGMDTLSQTTLAGLFAQRADTPLVLDADALNLLAGGALPGWGPGPVVLTPHAAEGARLLGVSTQAVLADRLGAARDRKSTRLNSSHVKISYAVFCLKKKK